MLAYGSEARALFSFSGSVPNGSFKQLGNLEASPTKV